MEPQTITIDTSAYNVHIMDDTYYIAVKKGATQADLHDNHISDALIGGNVDGVYDKNTAILRYSTGNTPVPTCAKGLHVALGALVGAGILFGVLKLANKL